MSRIKKFANFIEPPGATRYLDQVRKGIPRKVQEFLADPCLTLVVGSGRQDYGHNAIHLDRVRMGKLDVVADAHFLPFQAGTFNKVVIQQVLQYVDNPSIVIQETWRVLKKGGEVFCDIPFLYPLLGPHDYRRYSLNGLVEQFSRGRFAIVDKGADMGPSSIFSLVLRYYLSVLTSFNNKAIFQLGWIFWGYLTFWIKYLDSLIGRWHNSKADHINAQVYVIARKP